MSKKQTVYVVRQDSLIWLVAGDLAKAKAYLVAKGYDLMSTGRIRVSYKHPHTGRLAHITPIEVV